MISAPRIVVVSVIFFLTSLLYYSSANGADYTISERNPTAASAMKGSLHKTEKSYAKEGSPSNGTRRSPDSLRVSRARIDETLGATLTRHSKTSSTEPAVSFGIPHRYI